MGICGSKVEEDAPVVEEQQEPKPERKEKPKETAPHHESPREDKESSDFDFKETVKSVLLLILNRLVTALEYEQEGFLDLAQKRNKKKLFGTTCPAAL